MNKEKKRKEFLKKLKEIDNYMNWTKIKVNPEDKEEINDLCIQHNIDVEKNKIILSHISIQELQSKLEFLKANNIPIIDKDGLLNDIFSMSSLDMKEKYGISLDELISEYYIKKQKEKGV